MTRQVDPPASAEFVVIRDEEGHRYDCADYYKLPSDPVERIAEWNRICVHHIRSQFEAGVYGEPPVAQPSPPPVDPLASIHLQRLQLTALENWERGNSPKKLARRQKEWELIKAAVEGDAEAAKKQLVEDKMCGYSTFEFLNFSEVT